MKVNYVAFPFRQADDLVTNLVNPEGYGWDADKKVIWSDLSYSDEMNELLLFEERARNLTAINLKMMWMSRLKTIVDFKTRYNQFNFLLLLLLLLLLLFNVL